jgi:hypothetical protein
MWRKKNYFMPKIKRRMKKLLTAITQSVEQFVASTAI